MQLWEHEDLEVKIYGHYSKKAKSLPGLRVETRHFRGGQELPEVNKDNHYSTHFQEIRTLREPRIILPVSLSFTRFILKFNEAQLLTNEVES